MSSHESKIEDVRKEVHAQSEQSEIQLLQEKYDKLEQSFNESSSKLFESLREDDQVTDTKLQKDFESLCLAERSHAQRKRILDDLGTSRKAVR
jgi:hypothetical protein